MGNDLSTQKVLDQYDILEETYLSPFFGTCQLVQDKDTKQQFVLNEQNFENEEKLMEQKAKLDEKVKLLHKNVTELTGYIYNDEKEKSDFKIYTIYKYYKLSLLDEYNIKLKSNQFFSEDELKKIIQSMVNGLSYLQSKDISHQTLRLETITYDNGEIKINDITTFPIMHQYYKVVANPKDTSQIYLAPQLMLNLKAKNLKPVFDKYKSDMFTTGIILLQLATMKDQNDIYDYVKNDSINYELLNQRIQDLRSNYSQEFVAIITKMVCQKISERPDFLQLEIIVDNYINKKKEIKEENISVIQSKYSKIQDKYQQNEYNPWDTEVYKQSPRNIISLREVQQDVAQQQYSPNSTYIPRSYRHDYYKKNSPEKEHHLRYLENPTYKAIVEREQSPGGLRSKSFNRQKYQEKQQEKNLDKDLKKVQTPPKNNQDVTSPKKEQNTQQANQDLKQPQQNEEVQEQLRPSRVYGGSRMSNYSRNRSTFNYSRYEPRY